MDFLYKVFDLGWWHNNNPLYLVFDGSDPRNLAIGATFVLLAATGIAVQLRRPGLTIYLGVHTLAAFVFMNLLVGLANDYLSPVVGIVPNDESMYITVAAGLVALLNLIGAFGTFRRLEAKDVNGEMVPQPNRRSMRVFRASSYLLVFATFLAFATGAAGVSLVQWMEWTYLQVDYNAWLAVLLFACTTLGSSFFAFRRHHTVDRKRPLDGATTDTLRGKPYDKSQLGGPENTGGVRSDLTAGFDDHHRGAITNLGIGHRTPPEDREAGYDKYPGGTWPDQGPGAR